VIYRLVKWKVDVWVCQLSLCNESLRELSNPGASGSIFYITDDDEFIIKTVQYKEAEFLQKLLPGYYMVSVDVSLTVALLIRMCATYTVGDFMFPHSPSLRLMLSPKFGL